jgi:SPX domain protein involved in polyphosphate accumulation/uncharacterized membrane protein YidH (DUF202 family)
MINLATMMLRTSMKKDQSATTASIAMGESSSSSGGRPHNSETNERHNNNMSAFSVHEDALYLEISNARKRMSNSHVALEDAIAMNGNIGEYTATTGFCEVWEIEVARIGDFLHAQQQNLEFGAKALLTDVEASLNHLKLECNQGEVDDDELGTNKNDSSVEGMIHSWRVKAEELADGCLELQRFATQNKEKLEAIGTCADEKLQTSCVVALKRRFAMAPWKTGPNSALIVVLSDIYQVIRTAQELIRKDGSVDDESHWVAPSSFERRTSKYWVQEDQLTDLLLAAVVDAPLLVYGKSGRLTSKTECLSQRYEGDKLWDQLATPITSIYFDSPTLSLYKERLSRKEGSQLLRARWYGRRPTGNEILYLELKTHHEKWVNIKSLKERVAIREKDMMQFLSMEQWELKHAETIVLAACPTLDEASLQRAADRLLRMHDLVVRHSLRSCVRTCYLRAAFQSSSSNSLRLTVDRNVNMVDESKTTLGSWCLPEDAVIENTMAIRVPFLILEVKIASDDDGSPIAENLEQRGVIQEAAKFSKFLTGAAAFNMDKAGVLPYWAEHPEFASVFGASVPPSPNASKACSIATNEIGTDNKSDTTSESENSHSDKPVAANFFYPTASTLGTGRTPSQNAVFMSPGRSTLSKPSKKQGVSYLEDDTKVKRRGPFGIGALFRRNTKSSPSPSVASKRPVRVEPKSYFANERTFIQWVSSALLLVTISVILLGIDSEHGETSAYARKSGIIVCVGAVIVVFYATFVYFRRLKLLSRGIPYGYIDHFGPVVLALCVCTGVVVLLVYFLDEIRRAQALQVEKFYLQEQVGQCYKHSTSGISKLEYQPSDIVVDSQRNALLVPSGQRILLHSLLPPSPNRENTVKTLIEIPSSNLEGLTVVDDRVFALSEGPKRTELIELQWNGDDSLSITSRWKLSQSTEAEAIAYVPNKTRRSGRLFIDVNGEIQIYNLPDKAATPSPTPAEKDDDALILGEEASSEPMELDRIGSLNAFVLKSGLSELKIASMYFFEGIAYILHDNEMLLRAWDLDEGDLLAEIPLPRVEGGHSKEWEGVALERRGVMENQGDGSNLRGNVEQTPPTQSQLILHLALDTPAQIWSLVVQEGPTRGSLILPPCAVSHLASADSVSADESSDSIDAATVEEGEEGG